MTAERQGFFLVCGIVSTQERVPTYPRKQAPNQVYVARDGYRGQHVFVIGESAFYTAREAAAKALANHEAMTPDEVVSWWADQGRIADEIQAKQRARMQAAVEV